MTTGIVASPKIAKDGRIMSPKSLANLNPPYKPGQNGNPKPGNSLTARLKNMLSQRLPDKLPPDAPAGDQVAYATLKGAIDLVPVAFKETWDRTEGKVPDRHQVDANIRQISVVEVVIGNSNQD